MSSINYSQRPPWWFTALLIILVLPAGQTPMLLASAPAEPPVVKTLVWLYPLYTLVSAYLSWVCYNGRRLMSWILVALIVLTHVAIWLLVTSEI